MHNTLTLIATACIASSALAQTPDMQKLDKTVAGLQPTGEADFVSISTDGEFALFMSNQTNLVPTPAFAGNVNELYVRDLRTGVVEQVNFGSAGQALDVYLFVHSNLGRRAAISGDGRFVAFPTRTDDNGFGDLNNRVDVYLRDRLLGVTELISTGPTGATSFSNARLPSISDDGRFVLYTGSGSEFVFGLPPGTAGDQLYLRDRQLGQTRLVSHPTSSATTSDHVTDAILSADGNKLAYAVLNTTHQIDELRLYDVPTGTEFVLGNFTIEDGGLSIDATGTRIAFATERRGVVLGDRNLTSDVFVLDVATGVITPVNRASKGTRGFGPAQHPSLSPDGRYVAYDSAGGGLAPGHVGTNLHVYVHDLETGLTTLGSVNDLGHAGQGSQNPHARISSPRALGNLGNKLVFSSNFHNLAKPQTSNIGVFLRDRHTAGPDLAMSGLVAGKSAILHITGASSGGAVLVGFSLSGQGPLPSYWGLLDLSPPITTAYFTADASGVVAKSLHVPGSLTGANLFVQGIDLIGYEATTSFFGVVQ
jgi:hypothetical protein